MGLFGPYKYKTKKTKQIFYLHVKEKGMSRLYYFSKEIEGAINMMPAGYEVAENPLTGLPFLRKKTGFGIFGGLGGKSEDQKESEEEGVT